MRLFHGTTRKNADAILAKDEKTEYLWNCSCDDNVYFWCDTAMLESGEADDIEEARERAIDNAFQNGQIACAADNTPQSEIVVIELESSDNNEYVKIDESCPNMQLARCVDYDYLHTLDHIATHSCEHNSRLDAFVIAGILSQDEFNQYRLCDNLTSAAELIAKQSIFLEELLEFDYTTLMM